MRGYLQWCWSAILYGAFLVRDICGLIAEISIRLTRRVLRRNVKKFIKDDVILITGGGRGLGRQIALELAKYKPKLIILWGRNVEALLLTCTDIRTLGVTCNYMQCDIGIKEDIDKQAEEVKRKHGPVTMLVNNAATMFTGNFLEVRNEDIEKTFRVNILAQFRTVKLFLPDMQELKHGHIVTIGSCLGITGINGTTSYTSTKFAVTAFAESLAVMLDSEQYKGVETTIVYPFQINNDMFDGCENRFPQLFGPLDEEYVAVKTVDAILANTKSLLIPKLIGNILLLNTFLPFGVVTKINEFMGVSTAMEKCNDAKKS